MLAASVWSAPALTTVRQMPCHSFVQHRAPRYLSIDNLVKGPLLTPLSLCEGRAWLQRRKKQMKAFQLKFALL